jgi:peroxiredoxin
MHKQQTSRALAGAVATASLLLVPGFLTAQAVVGESAPGFSATDTSGKTQTLAAYKGRHTVLEWFNPDCPFVRKHYDSRAMQNLQKTYTGKGVAWLMIASSAPGKQGHLDAQSGAAVLAAKGAQPTALLLDAQGVIGRAYGAKTTPHMFVIDPAGKVIYAGGIDDKPSTSQADLAGAHNYVAAALDAALAGKPIATPSSAPYGCSVKYAN